jgi:hypothetical protein
MRILTGTVDVRVPEGDEVQVVLVFIEVEILFG